MDAKPQRPTRAIRVRDENQAPPHASAAGKTLHHRNKSTSALSTVLGNAPLKNATKRTAFGDVSNVVNPVQAGKDDAAAIPKQGSEKPVQEKQSAALSRPAQRPASIANLKGLLNNVTGDKPAVSASDSRKLPLKRSNTVYKDPAVLPTVAETTVPSKAVDVARNLPSVPVGAASKQQSGQEVKSIEAVNEHVDFSTSTGSPDTCDALRSDGVHIGDNGELKDYGRYEDESVNDKENVKPSNKLSKSIEEHSGAERYKDESVNGNEIVKQSNVIEKHSATTTIAKPVTRESYEVSHIPDHIAIPSEPEEYWDEEEDNYEDDDYVTAPSHRYRSDNTTGGNTTVLFPKFNQKAKRELVVAKQIVESSRTMEDWEDELWDTTMVAEYGDEIFQYMKDLEIKMLPNADYMDNQAEIQWSMRSVLMDWLVQVHHRFALLPETLFLCVNYIDRFLSCKIVSLGKLQLVGATAIFIAAKYEEINCPSLQEIVYMVDNGYTAEEILKAERFMLSMLQFELGWPGPMSFLRRISKADDYDLETRTLAKYFLEVTIMDERFVGTPPSFTAAGAHCLARLMLRKGIWSPAHVHYSGYTYSQLHPLVSLILECCQEPQKHHSAIFDKYSDRRFRRASFFVETEIRKGFRLIDVSKDPSASALNNMVNHGFVWKKP